MATAAVEPEPESADASVARTIRGVMAERQISGSSMATMIGMPQRAFSRRHRGEVEWTFDEAERIARNLGMTLAELVERARRDSNSQPSDQEPVEPIRLVPTTSAAAVVDAALAPVLPFRARILCPLPPKRGQVPPTRPERRRTDNVVRLVPRQRAEAAS